MSDIPSYWIVRRPGRPALIAAAAAALAAAVAGCITINIYFPASAIEKAADRIIDEVWSPAAAGPPPAPGGPVPAREGGQ